MGYSISGNDIYIDAPQSSHQLKYEWSENALEESGTWYVKGKTLIFWGEEYTKQ